MDQKQLPKVKSIQLFLKSKENEAIPLIPANQLPHSIAKRYWISLSNAEKQGQRVFIVDTTVPDGRLIAKSTPLENEEPSASSYHTVTIEPLSGTPSTSQKKDKTSRQDPDPEHAFRSKAAHEERRNVSGQQQSSKSSAKDKKEYCSHWLSHGRCDFMQTGCKYKHEMPTSLKTLKSINGFTEYPKWYLAEQFNAQDRRGRTKHRARPAAPEAPSHSYANKRGQGASAVSAVSIEHSEPSLIDFSPQSSPERRSHRRLSRGSSLTPSTARTSSPSDAYVRRYDADHVNVPARDGADSRSPVHRERPSRAGGRAKKSYFVRRSRDRSTTYVATTRRSHGDYSVKHSSASSDAS